MTEPPRRKRFQIHLSTAIVMMFVAGGLQLLNFVPSHGRLVMYVGDIEGEYTERQARVENAVWYGFPFVAYVAWPNWDIRCYSGKTNMALNLFSAIAILYSVWYACEWRIRRRAARKGA